MVNGSVVLMDKFVPFSSVISLSELYFSIFDAMLIALALHFLLRLPGHKRRRNRHPVLSALFAAYLGAVAALTLFPIYPLRFSFDLQTLLQELASASLLPFVGSVEMIQNGLLADNMMTVFYNLGGNLLLLMPFGVFVPVLFRTKPFKTIVLAFVSAFCIELLQLVENVLHLGYNVVSFDDFFLNAVGCIIAYLLYLGIRTAFRKR